MRERESGQSPGAAASMTDDDVIMVPMSRADLAAVSHLHRCLPSIGGGPCRSCDVAQTFVAQARAIVDPLTVAPQETRAPAAPRARLAKG
jgi:hypothetical protein